MVRQRKRPARVVSGEAHLCRRAAPERVMSEKQLDEVDGVRSSCREVEVPGLLRDVRQRHVVRQSLVALSRSKSDHVDQWDSTIGDDNGEQRTGQSSSVGLPIALHVFFSWSKSDSPARNGTRSISSAKMQPTDHMSTVDEYARAPKSSSGGLYHRVMTWQVILPVPSPKSRARPKSAILRTP
jgi:hypothetical protein